MPYPKPLRTDTFHNPESFRLYKGHMVRLRLCRGIGKISVIKHTDISSVECMNIHIKWGTQPPISLGQVLLLAKF